MEKPAAAVKSDLMKSMSLAVLLLFAIPLVCRSEEPVNPKGEAPAVHSDDSAPLPLNQVSTWAYQIQKLNDPGAVDALASSTYDLLVVEPTRTDWSDDASKKFDARQMVTRLKGSKAGDGVHRKRVLAYIDIGEAEDWRWYWTWSKKWPKGKPRPADWPEYIAIPDPDGWSGDYPVCFFDPLWKDLIIYGKNQPATAERPYTSMIDEAVQDGFDGIYLDWVEAYQNDVIAGQAKKKGLDPAAEMIKFIGEMREYAKARNPDFIIIQQNAAELLDGHPELLKVIDAIGQEDLWYRGAADKDWESPKGHDIKTKSDENDTHLANLTKFLKSGKPVFTIHYTVKHADDVYALARAKGFVPYCSRTALSRLTTTPPPGMAEVPSFPQPESHKK
jgi:cysteinyl-tRNA synthetase